MPRLSRLVNNGYKITNHFKSGTDLVHFQWEIEHFPLTMPWPSGPDNATAMVLLLKKGERLRLYSSYRRSPLSPTEQFIVVSEGGL